MERMLFSGLIRLAPGEPLSTDNFSFQSENPRIIDRLLELGALTHRHDAAPPLANPVDALVLATADAGGAIPSDLDIYLGYTLLDDDNGETALSPAEMVTTPAGIVAPESALVAAVDYTAGTLLTDTYYYALTWTDGIGGETGMGPTVPVEREPGFANAQVMISGLSAGMADAGAVGWRLYRATGGAEFGLIATGLAAQDTFTDNGLGAVDCTQLPPADFENSTGSTNTLSVTLPAAVPVGAAAIRLYVSLDGSFAEGGLIGTYPVPDDLGTVKTFTSLEVVPARPPAASTAIGGASKIDPDTELLNWHWKRPVANQAALPAVAEEGDVRIALDDGIAYRYVNGAWGAWSGAVLNFRGAYDPAVAYDERDVVLLDGTSYRAVAPSTGVNPATDPGTTWAILAAGAPGGGLPSRADVGGTAAGLAAGASADLELAAGRAWTALRLTTNRPTRVRIYPTAAHRAADAGRAAGVDPTGDHGVLLDYVTTAANLAPALAPPPVGFNLDAPLSDLAYVRVTNLDAAAGDVTVTLTRITQEA